MNPFSRASQVQRVKYMEHSETLSCLTQTHTLVLYDAQRQCWLCFHHPVQVLQTTSTTEILPLLETVQQQVQQGFYAAGFVSYEAASAFDSSFQVHPDTSLKIASGQALPLVWFGLYSSPQVISLPSMGSSITPAWMPSIFRDRYRTAIHRIKRYIAQGQTYQVNFSFRLRAAFAADPLSYFVQLMEAQESQYGAFVNLENWAICCASPELFFRLNDRLLTCRPMKGTTPRGLTYHHDRALASELQRSVKNRAENVMIVDMIRNDMGQVATTGSVQVTHLFDVEQYPTLWQMTSPVECTTDAPFVDIFRALFPCASITGAPKPRTMQIIAELEDSPRQIYTGSIGFLAPDRTAQFNVAIRTVLIDKVRQSAEYGVGGGIVWDSVETDEFEECCTKAKILTRSQPSFELLESLRWTPVEGYFLLDLHLQRLQESAAYFAFHLNLDQVQHQLEAIAQTLPPQPHKVRLRVAKTGSLKLEAESLKPQEVFRPLKVGLAPFPIHSADVFLYHKTTHRLVYQQAKQTCPDWDDVLLWNERQELTESCIANLVVEWEGQWFTPPVQCGLLAGTFRAWLLQQGKVKERVIRVEELIHCSRIWLVNSVREMQEVEVHHEADAVAMR